MNVEAIAAGRGAGSVGIPRRILAMFPGQGSQRPGMAAHLLRDHPETAGRVFALADDLLGLDLTRVCVSGDAEDLVPTEIAQPAIVATGLAVLETLRAGGFAPDLVAGHSLGEFAALTAAGVLDAADALRLARIRGELMAGVSATVPGAMIAIFGVDAARVEQICAEADGVAEVANYNEPGQSVISGTRDAVEAAAARCLADGATKTVELRVSAPFHCSLMAGIEDEFAAALREVAFRDPRVPVLSSVTARPITDAAHAVDLLRRQLTGPVRWVELLRAADALGVTDYLEVGPGRVLSGLANRVVTGTVRSTQDSRRIAAVLADHT